MLTRFGRLFIVVMLSLVISFMSANSTICADDNTTSAAGYEGGDDSNAEEITPDLDIEPEFVEVGKNTLFGENAGRDIDSLKAFHNTFLGFKSGLLTTTGSRNTFLGSLAGRSNIIGSDNVFIGYQAGFNETGWNKLYIANSKGTPLIYGNFKTGNVGIGTTTPAAKLEVDGNISVLGRRDVRFWNADNTKTAYIYGGTVGEGSLTMQTSMIAIHITENGNVGIGITDPMAKLDVTGLSTLPIVQGINMSTGAGVRGESNSGRGVYGKNNTLGNYGQLGDSKSGVYGETFSPLGAGVWGKDNSSIAAGVYGEGDHYGVKGTGGTAGVYGESTNGDGVYGESIDGNAGYFSGNVYITGDLSKGSGTFVQPHTKDPSKEIKYAFFEGPEHAVFLRGTAQLKDGKAIIELPEHFRIVAAQQGVSVQFTPRSSDTFGLAAIEVSTEKIVVEELKGEKHTYEFDYFITAVRAGFEEHKPVVANKHFRPGRNETVEEFERRFSKDDMTTRAMRTMLISNGILTEDGKLDMAMVETLGWIFAEKAEDKGGDKFVDKELYLSRSEY